MSLGILVAAPASADYWEKSVETSAFKADSPTLYNFDDESLNDILFFCQGSPEVYFNLITADASYLREDVETLDPGRFAVLMRAGGGMIYRFGVELDITEDGYLMAIGMTDSALLAEMTQGDRELNVALEVDGNLSYSDASYDAFGSGQAFFQLMNECMSLTS